MRKIFVLVEKLNIGIVFLASLMVVCVLISSPKYITTISLVQILLFFGIYLWYKVNAEAIDHRYDYITHDVEHREKELRSKEQRVQEIYRKMQDDMLSEVDKYKKEGRLESLKDLQEIFSTKDCGSLVDELIKMRRQEAKQFEERYK